MTCAIVPASTLYSYVPNNQNAAIRAQALRNLFTDMYNTMECVRASQVLSESNLVTGLAITSGTVMAPVAHGLSGTPKVVDSYLTCVNPNNGYAAGDVVHVPDGIWDDGIAAPATGQTIEAGPTNIIVHYGTAANVYRITSKTTGALVNVLNADWLLNVSVYL